MLREGKFLSNSRRTCCPLAGLAEAQGALDRLESGSTFSIHNVSPGNTLNGRGGPGGAGDDRLYLSKLRASLDAICEEYNSCATYMSRISNSLVKVRCFIYIIVIISL